MAKKKDQSSGKRPTVPDEKRPSKRRRNALVAAGVAAGVATAVGVAVVRSRRKRTAESAGACTLQNRAAVSRLVIEFLNELGFPDAAEASDFENDIFVTTAERQGWAGTLRTRVRERGCDPGAFGPSDTSGAETVGEIVDALWAEVKANQEVAAKGVVAEAVEPCTLTSRAAVSMLVIAFLNELGFPDASEPSDFENDIFTTTAEREGWAGTLRERVRDRGCDPGEFSPADYADAETVAGVVTALWEAVNA